MKRGNELERLVTMQKKEIEAKKSQNIPVRQNPIFHHRLSLKHSQKVEELEEELTCEICAMRMWLPYRYIFAHPRLAQRSLTIVLG